MPDALERPRPRRAVVEQVLADGALVDELVALAARHAVGAFLRAAARGLPGLAAVGGALDDLPEPAAGLGGIDPLRIGGGALHVVDLPPREQRTLHLPA